LARARQNARFPWISSNTTVDTTPARGGAECEFAGYIVKTVGGVKVAVIGITTPLIPLWERAENVVSQLAEQVPDLDAIVFGLSHAELEGHLVGKVLLVQPKNGGASLARI